MFEGLEKEEPKPTFFVPRKGMLFYHLFEYSVSLYASIEDIEQDTLKAPIRMGLFFAQEPLLLVDFQYKRAYSTEVCFIQIMTGNPDPRLGWFVCSVINMKTKFRELSEELSNVNTR
jgi:hypothetical protein